jgi:glycosyltransferase involved in cell wall biosynthesis
VAEGRNIVVGFDVSQTGATKAGCGYFADAMHRALVSLPDADIRYVLYPSFGSFYFDPGLALAPEALGLRETLGPRHRTLQAATAYWQDPDLEQSLGEVDIVHSNNFWCPEPLTRVRLVYTLYDLSFVEHPEWTTEANRTGCFDGVFRASVNADWIVAISHASKAHFMRCFPHFPEERITVVYPCSRFRNGDAGGTAPACASRIERHRYWLSVGTIEPRKNQERLLEAYRRLLDAGGEAFPLVLAGGAGWMMEHLTSTVAALGLADRVVLTGYVTDAELTWLYRNCMCNVYPSLFEGFGLPVLEGMQMGCPTICSSTTSLPEVAGDAALLVDPLSVEQLCDAMLKVATNAGMRDGLRRRSLEQARRFSWEASARQLAALYREVAGAPKRIC